MPIKPAQIDVGFVRQILIADNGTCCRFPTSDTARETSLIQNHRLSAWETCINLPGFGKWGLPMKRQWILVGWVLGSALLSSFCSLSGRAVEAQDRPAKKMKVVVFGGHPDDPESGAGGLIKTLTGLGHEVIVAYGTAFRGDRQLFGRPEADVRRAEASAACKILGATPKFFPYSHEKLTADQATFNAVSGWFAEVKPDIVVTHWPLDTHPNHHAVSSLVWQCYERNGGWNLYFFEVMTDQQTIAFKPELYLDIKSVREIKRRSLDEHKSQDPAQIWTAHDRMHRRRGAECGSEFAEAYSLVEAKPGCPLLPVRFRPSS